MRTVRNIILILAGMIFGVVFFFLAGWLLIKPERVAEEIRQRPAAGRLDGQGEALATPCLVPADAEGLRIELAFTAGRDGIAPGGGFQFYFPAQVIDYPDGREVEAPAFDNWRFANPRMYTGGFYSVRAPRGVRVRLRPAGAIKIFKVAAAFLKSARAGSPAIGAKEANREISRVRVKVARVALKPGGRITVVIGAGGRLATPHYPTHVDIAVESDIDGDGSFRPIAKSPSLHTRCRAERLEVIAPSTPRPREKFTIVIQSGCVDIYPAPDPAYSARVRLESNGLSMPQYVEIKPGMGGRASVEASAPKEGVYRVTAYDGARGWRATGNPIVCRKRGLRLYWGDLRRYTILGDGEWKPTTVLYHAREMERLDFAAVTDHDSGSAGYIAIGGRGVPNPPGGRMEEKEWRYLEYVAAGFNQPGRFAALAGYEWAGAAAGARCVYFRPGSETYYFASPDPAGGALESLLKFYEDRQAAIVPNNTASRGSDMRGGAMDWGGERYTRQRLVEVYSQDGAGEYFGNPFPIHAAARVFLGPSDGARGGRPPSGIPWYAPLEIFQASDASPPGRGDYVMEALAAGRRLTLIAGSGAHFLSFYRTSYPGGLTAAWAPGLTAGDVWSAVFGRQVYGTTGARIYIEFTVNCRPIGSYVVLNPKPDPSGRSNLICTLPPTFDPNGPPALKGVVFGTAPLAKVEVVRFCGGVYKTVYSGNSPTPDLKFYFEDFSFASPGFYYLRVTQADGRQAWAGPTWVRYGRRSGR